MPERYSQLDFLFLQKQVERARLREDALRYQREIDHLTLADIGDVQEEIDAEVKAAFSLLDL